MQEMEVAHRLLPADCWHAQDDRVKAGEYALNQLIVSMHKEELRRQASYYQLIVGGVLGGRAASSLSQAVSMHREAGVEMACRLFSADCWHAWRAEVEAAN